MRSLIYALLATVVSGLRSNAPLPPMVNNAPTIGILSVPMLSDGSPCASLRGADGSSPSCFKSFYPKWVENAGARAVFIPYDADAATLKNIMDSINGVLFTGGELEAAGLAWDAPYMVTAAAIFKAAKEKNDAGVFMPIHGTCQGFQVLSLLGSMNQSIMAYNVFDAENYSIPLDMTWDSHHSTRLFDEDFGVPDAVVSTLANLNVTLNLHHDGVPVVRWEENAALTAFFALLSTNFDRNGAAFASTLEAWNYPFTGTQWHPERNQFEWRNNNADHSADGVTAMQYMSNFFVGDARRNLQTFNDTALFARLSIYSYPWVNAADSVTSGVQWIVADL